MPLSSVLYSFEKKNVSSLNISHLTNVSNLFIVHCSSCDRSVEPFSFIWKMVDMEEKDSEQWKSLILFHYEGTGLEVNGSNKNFQRNL